jgi:transposase
MDIIYAACAGLDVHKKTVVACCLITTADGTLRKEIRTFGTMTADLLALSDWLLSQGVTHLAMESTGEFWKPIYNLLEAAFTILVVNAQHIKNVPGRKTDVKDAEWIATLLRHGLLRGSFIPPLPQRDLRDLTRQRTTLVRERAAVINRLQKVLEWANLKLAAVASNVVGVSARAMLEAIVAGQGDVTALADLARGRMRSKRAELERALTGHVRDHHRFLLVEHLGHIDYLDDAIDRFDQQIAAHIAAQVAPTPLGTDADERAGEVGPGAAVPEALPSPTQQPPLSWDEAVALIDTVPGIARTSAELVLAEIGSDMTRFRDADQLASWARVCPGNHESAGRRYSGATGKGNLWLKSGLVQAAHAAVKQKDTDLAAVYRRLVARRGVKRAIIAVAHRMVIAIYHILSKREPYRELGGNYLNERSKERLVNRMCHRIEAMGYTVSLEPTRRAAA